MAIHLLSSIIDDYTFSVYLNFDSFFELIHGQSRLLNQFQLPVNILAIEVQYTEMYINSFMTHFTY